MNCYLTYYQSPIGKLPLIANETALMAVLWENDDPRRVLLPATLIKNDNAILIQTKQQLSDYFEGKRKAFDVPLEMNGTAFQKSIWNQLQKIPFGETRSYGQLAKNIGQPTASRAVGAANGKNPISIIVPCHRVIGTNRKFTGFAGGIKAKEYLLQLEGKLNLF